MLLASFPGPSPLQRGGAWELGTRLVCYLGGTHSFYCSKPECTLTTILSTLTSLTLCNTLLYASYKKLAGSEARDMLRPIEI